MGSDVCGIANIERFQNAPEGFSPQDIFSECRSVVVFGKALPKGLTKVKSRLIYAHYNELICAQVDAIALHAARSIEKECRIIAVPLPCDGPYDYWDKETLTGKGLLSMKHAAVLAGLGQLGKNSLLLNAEYGNLLTIGAILLDTELVSDPLVESICKKNCTKCIEQCPVHAINNQQVNQYLCREHTYGKTVRGFNTVECNQCRVICPMKYGNKGIRRN